MTSLSDRLFRNRGAGLPCCHTRSSVLARPWATRAIVLLTRDRDQTAARVKAAASDGDSGGEGPRNVDTAGLQTAPALRGREADTRTKGTKKWLLTVLDKMGPAFPSPFRDLCKVVTFFLGQGTQEEVVSGAGPKLAEDAEKLAEILEAYPNLFELADGSMVEGYQQTLKEVVDFANELDKLSSSRNVQRSDWWQMEPGELAAVEVEWWVTMGVNAEKCEKLKGKCQKMIQGLLLVVAADNNAILRRAERKEEKVKALVSQLGGIEAVAADGDKRRQVQSQLSVGEQLLLEKMVQSVREEGPHDEISHPVLRSFWKRMFKGRPVVPWAEWWVLFPARLPKALPGGLEAATTAAELQELLYDKEARQSFELAVAASGEGYISVYDLGDVFTEQEELEVQVRRLLQQPNAVRRQQAQQVAALPADATLQLNSRIPALPACYVGRDEEATVLTEALLTRGSVVLLGAGGMGKSCLAADISRRLEERREAAGVLWVDLREASAMSEVEARFCAALDLEPEERGNTRRVSLALRQRAQQAGGPVLVVVDNAEDALLGDGTAEPLRALLIAAVNDAPRVRVLVTSRISLQPASPQAPFTTTSQLLEERPIRALSPAEAVGLVRMVAADLKEAEAQEVAAACQCVPLVLQLVADALNTGRLMLEDLDRLTEVQEGADSTGASVRLVLGSLKRKQLACAAQLAVFPSAFDDDAAAAVLGLESAAEAHSLAAVLCRHSVLGRAGSQQYVMHSVVRQQATELVREAGLTLLARAEGRFVGLVLRRLTDWAEMYQTATGWRRALAEGRAQRANIEKMLDILAAEPAKCAAGSTDSGTWDPEAVGLALTDDLMSLLVALLPYSSRERRAWDAVWQRLDQKDQQAQSGSRSWLEASANTLRDVASAQLCLRRISARPTAEEAEVHARRGVELREMAVGWDHPDMASSLEILADCLHTQGRFQEAVKYYSRALELRRRLLGNRHVLTASSLVSLAICFGAQDRYPEAEDLHREALELRRRLLGEEHPLTGASRNHLASCFCKRGRHSQAEPLIREAVEVTRRVLGDDCEHTVYFTHNLASCLFAQGKYSEAESLWHRALELIPRACGDADNPIIPHVRRGLAACADAKVRYPTKEMWHRQRLEQAQQKLGEEHPDTARIISNLATCIRDQGRIEEAEPLYRRALALLQQSQEEEHQVAAAFVAGNLATCIFKRGDYSEAEQLYRHALQGCRLGAEALSIVPLANDLAYCLRIQGRLLEAEKLYAEMLELVQQKLGEEDVNIVRLIEDLATCISNQDRHSEAEPLYRKALAISWRMLGQEDRRTVRLAAALQNCLLAQGRRIDAAEVARELGQNSQMGGGS